MKFECRYEAEDGYCGKSRPQTFNIDSDDVENCETEEELRELYQDEMHTSFDQKIYPVGLNEDDFIDWAMDILNKKHLEE